MGESVYFANLKNPNGSIRHTGDELTGDEDLGSGDDEIIVIDLRSVPSSVWPLSLAHPLAPTLAPTYLTPTLRSTLTLH